MWLQDLNETLLQQVDGGRKTMDTHFQKLLDDIKKSTKTVHILPSEDTIKSVLKNTYEINSKSLLSVILEYTV